MKRSDFLRFVGFGAASTVMSGYGLSKLNMGKVRSSRQPNIVIILSDDLGYAELSCQGAKDLRTPNIDSLARDGIRCTDAYSSGPVCAPTRA